MEEKTQEIEEERKEKLSHREKDNVWGEGITKREKECK